MKKVYVNFFAMLISFASLAQVQRSKTIDNGGSGPYKAIAATEATLSGFTVYRPVDIGAAAEAESKLPLIVFGNGACSNSSLYHERLLSEIASHGYILISIGGLQMSDNDPSTGESSPQQLLKAVEWVANKTQDASSDYYNNVDLDKVVAGGQSCGGAQAIAVAGDPLITGGHLIFNSGIGDMEMEGATSQNLSKLKVPIIYIVGGPSDVAHDNAVKDHGRITTVESTLSINNNVGHEGTFGTVPYGGTFATMAIKWLDWHLKGKYENCSVFIDKDLSEFSNWTVDIKNVSTSCEPENKDCAGVAGGTAYLDECDECVGGTTGKEECVVVKDCAGEAGGSAFIDECGECVGGNTGKEECVIEEPKKTYKLKKGWNIVGCIMKGETDVKVAISGINDYVEAVKDAEGFYDVSVAEELNSLSVLKWGHGYFIKVNSDCELTW